jgi:hypothetical protein
MEDVLEPTALSSARWNSSQSALHARALAISKRARISNRATELAHVHPRLFGRDRAKQGAGDAADDLYQRAHDLAYEQEQDIILDEEPHVSPTHLEAAEAALARFQIALVEAEPIQAFEVENAQAKVASRTASSSSPHTSIKNNERVSL